MTNHQFKKYAFSQFEVACFLFNSDGKGVFDTFNFTNTPIMSIIKRIEEIVGWISLSDFYDV